jgi:hypothetical protein
VFSGALETDKLSKLTIAGGFLTYKVQWTVGENYQKSLNLCGLMS